MEVQIKSLLVLNILLTLATANFYLNCPQECKCLWASGNKKADCSESSIHDIPKTLSSEIQILDLTGNELYAITNHAFEDVGLINLKKLILRRNKIRTVHQSGMSGLAIMIELDLSNNELKTLHPDTFRETSKIRRILLNGNQIERLEDRLFNNLPFLQNVNLSDNKIVILGSKTFMDVPKLNTLRLDSNNLEHIQVDTLNMITSLSNLAVHDNPWRCDCNLLPFKNWVNIKNFNTSKIACNEPPKVHGKLWKELGTSDFTCQPSILRNTTMTHIPLSCQAHENPFPEENWVLNTKIIDGAYRYQGEVKYHLPQTGSENKWVNLTINLCIAKNPEGVQEQSLTLTIAPTIPGVIVQ